MNLNWKQTSAEAPPFSVDVWVRNGAVTCVRRVRQITGIRGEKILAWWNDFSGCLDDHHWIEWAPVTNPRDEEWRPVLNYEGLYEVSNYGNVRAMFRTRNLRSGRIKKPTIGANGYYMVNLRPPGTGGRVAYVHRLVLEAFIGPFPKGMETRHLDGTRTNNHLSNLKIGTPQENTDDKYRHGTIPLGRRSQNGKTQ